MSLEQGNTSEDFPFKKKTRYRVIKQWYKNGTTFEVGQEFEFIDTIYNRYDDVKIYQFKELTQGYTLGWPCSVYETDKWKEYFQKIKSKKVDPQ